MQSLYRLWIPLVSVTFKEHAVEKQRIFVSSIRVTFPVNRTWALAIITSVHSVLSNAAQRLPPGLASGRGAQTRGCSCGK